MDRAEITARAASATLSVARSAGLAVHSAKLIGGYANTMFRVEPLPLVARVATASHAVRAGGTDWLKRETEVAVFLASAGAKAIRPATIVSPGPHVCDGLALTFWDYAELTGQSVSPELLGERLCALHEAMADCPVALPKLEALAETWRILETPDYLGKLDAESIALIARRSDAIRHQLERRPLDCRPLHGDAHHGNLWQTPNGPVWGDFEDTHLGPVEWDLACMVASSHVFGCGAAAEAALASYGKSHDTDMLDLLIEARTLQGVAWSLVTQSEPSNNNRLKRRLAWLDT